MKFSLPVPFGPSGHFTPVAITKKFLSLYHLIWTGVMLTILYTLMAFDNKLRAAFPYWKGVGPAAQSSIVLSIVTFGICIKVVTVILSVTGMHLRLRWAWIFELLFVIIVLYIFAFVTMKRSEVVKKSKGHKLQSTQERELGELTKGHYYVM